MENVRGFLRRQAVLDGDGIDESLVLVHERGPGFLVSSQAFLDQARIIPSLATLFLRGDLHRAHRLALSGTFFK